ncbi:MAG TPA: hypothetical protein VMW47_09490 [Verrucomicrobiae bacterium]|nr:hypothetical protein [Verrucomicrobiae bacterium]
MSRTAPVAAAPRARASSDRWLRGAVVGMLMGLLLEYAVGMVVNLFVTIPLHHPGHDSGSFLTGAVAVVTWAIREGGALAIHASFGIVLALSSVVVFGRTLALRRRGLAWLTGIGALTVVGAGFNGASFLIFDYNQSSLVMAWLFALALLAYVLSLVRLPAADPRDLLAPRAQDIG